MKATRKPAPVAATKKANLRAVRLLLEARRAIALGRRVLAARLLRQVIALGGPTAAVAKRLLAKLRVQMAKGPKPPGRTTPRAPAPRMGRNPFTGEPIRIRSKAPVRQESRRGARKPASSGQSRRTRTTRSAKPSPPGAEPPAPGEPAIGEESLQFGPSAPLSVPQVTMPEPSGPEPSNGRAGSAPGAIEPTPRSQPRDAPFRAPQPSPMAPQPSERTTRSAPPPARRTRSAPSAGIGGPEAAPSARPAPPRGLETAFPGPTAMPSPAPAGMPPPSPPEEPAVVTRTPHMDISPAGDMHPGTRFTIEVFADTAAAAPGEVSEPVMVIAPRDQKRFDLEVWLSATDHFVIEEPRVAKLVLDADQPATAKLMFLGRVREDVASGKDAAIFAYFFYNGRPSGRVSRNVRIVVGERPAETARASDAPPPIRDSLAVDAGAPMPDLSIDITDPTRNRRNLKCRVVARQLPVAEQPAPEDWNLASESGDLVRAFMDEFMSPAATPAERVLSLKGAGQSLYEAAPESFKQAYWTLVDRGTPPHSILIVSQEPFIPWELMIPFRRRPDGTLERRPQPLGVECAVGRWLHEGHVAPSTRVPLVDSFVIAPTYPGPKPSPLRKTAEEIQLVLAAVPGTRVQPADVLSIGEQLGQGGRSLVHFACHGADSPKAGIQAVFLDGGVSRLTSIAVGQIDGVMTAFQKKPLVFLNACEVGRPAIALVGIGGFAKAFIDLGAAGVIAPLWSVSDTTAFDVAQRFYSAAKQTAGNESPPSFAEILAGIRKLAYDPAVGDDTYAAYIFYGDPAARA